MGSLSKSFAFGFVLALICLPPLHAQTATTAPADTKAPAASPSSSAQAPDDMTKKITELVHDGKYPEAQQLTTGLLAAYPNDQRLLKAKALIETLLASASQAAPGSSQPAPIATAVQLTGMDKIDYNALIELARAAQQNTDLEQQKASLKQFMDRSSPFLQKHPEEMLVWQLRAASAISLNDPMAGYEAGQKLLAAGAADSNDQNLQSLLGQLKNKEWLDQQEATKQAEKIKTVISILGTWTVHYSWDSWADQKGRDVKHGDYGEECSKSDSVSDSVIECYKIENGRQDTSPNLRGIILDSGEINWEKHVAPWNFDVGSNKWTFEIGSDKRTMKSFVTATGNVGTTAFGKDIYKKGTLTVIYTKK
jgi:hypothetical protein